MKAILAIDQGTTSTRAIAFSIDGKKLFSSQLEFKQYFPKNGWVEHNPNEIWLKTLKVICLVRFSPLGFLGLTPKILAKYHKNASKS